MNEIIKQLSNRRSVRSFAGEKVNEADLELIFKTAQRAPTSKNCQQVSIVYTRDKEKIKKIAELCGGQKQVESADVFVIFVADFLRTSYAAQSLGKEQIIEKSAEGITIGSVDAGIMLSSLQSAAESLGYGTTPIGAVRNSPEQIIEIFELPAKTYPMVGSTIGVPTKEAKDAPLKPRIPYESFVFEDKYDSQKVFDGVEQYEKDLKSFREKNGMDYLTSYKDIIVSSYSKFRRKVKKSFESQGFRFEDE